MLVRRESSRTLAACEADAIAQEAEDASNKTVNEFVELRARADDKAGCEANPMVEDKSDSSDGSSVTNVNVESVPLLVTEERVEFDLGVIDSYGRLIGEYSTLDDELRIC